MFVSQSEPNTASLGVIVVFISSPNCQGRLLDSLDTFVRFQYPVYALHDKVTKKYMKGT